MPLRPKAREPLEEEDTSTWEDAKLALQEFGSWIKNADTKVTVLAAALGVTISLVGAKSETLVLAYRASGSTCPSALWCVLLLFLISVLFTAHYIYKALNPRMETSSEFSRFSWTSMAALAEAPKSFPSSGSDAEAWAQAHVLSRIAREKYKSLRAALICFASVMVTGAVLVALATWLTAG